MTERRITLTGGWVEVKRRVPPEEMTDKELKRKVCSTRKECCERCTILDGCGWGKEFVKRMQRKPGREKIYEKTRVYPGLNEWFEEHNMTYTTLGSILFPESEKESASHRVRDLMTGKTNSVSLKCIFKLIELTGKTFEELFRRDDDLHGD